MLLLRTGSGTGGRQEPGIGCIYFVEVNVRLLVAGVSEPILDQVVMVPFSYSLVTSTVLMAKPGVPCAAMQAVTTVIGRLPCQATMG